jgi:hypothetical protein
LLAGCNGFVLDREAVDPAEDPVVRSLGLGPAPMRRLTRAQYERAIATAFPGVEPVVDLPQDDASAGFRSFADSTITDREVQTYLRSAEAIAERVGAELERHLGACAADAVMQDACAAAYFARIGRLLFRRPLDAPETALVVSALYEPFKARYGFETAVESALVYLLQAVPFLYRIEIGSEGDRGPSIHALDRYELASRLSFLIWDSGPDEELLDAAAAGALDDAAGLEAEARRMLADPRASATLESFHAQLLRTGRLDQIEKDPARFPGWSPALRAAMHDELGAFVDAVVREGDGRIDTLLTARFTVASDLTAAAFYERGAGRIDFPAGDPRGGLLTQPAFLAANSGTAEPSIVHRGLTIRRNLLCQTVPDPPPGVTMTEGVSRLEVEPCASCHRLMDPIGRVFDRFDAIGALRAEAVGTSGEIVSTQDIDGPIDGAADVEGRLATSAEFTRCYVRQWLRYTNGRELETLEEPVLEAVEDRFVEADGDVRELLVAVIAHEAFGLRRFEASGACE